ncbi:MAG TPA: Crp/Fnr family transcriptional regulator [Gemmatimonadaceae bacterium]|jgi:CRP-like cAMP-binding protein|nr:Crp/Fnr family transcriptional regulator [Gemmatimonadaceae bacterium]
MSLKMKSPPSIARPATSNLLLAALSPDDLALITPQLEPVMLNLRDVLYEPGADITHAYFPTTGCVSMIHGTSDGSVEVGTIGLEGLVGVPILLRASSEPTRALVQVEGEAYRIPAEAFRSVVAESEHLERIMLRYALALFNQVAQSVACNRLHSLEERCARWLLITHDRVDGDVFKLTQEFLSYMLGVHRPAVTLAAGVLQAAGYIKYSRGTITVTDREGLEGASCSCYQQTQDDYALLAS